MIKIRKLTKFLINKNFEDFFIYINNIKIKNIYLKEIIEELKRPIYCLTFNHIAIVLLRDSLEFENFITNKYLIENKKLTEKYLKKYILNNFKKIFPNYTFIKSEYIVKNIGKIDILGKENNTNRDVIIELKIDEKNPNKQLIAYSKNFKNPILIGITNMKEKYYLDFIKYYTLKEIGFEEKVLYKCTK